METRMRTTTRMTRAVLAALLLIASSAPAIAGEEAEKKGEKETEKINASWEFARANRLASAGAITRSIPHYEKVLEAAPEKFPQAHFNLAEVYRFKEECRKAVLLYNAYLTFEQDEDNRADAKKGIEQCKAGAAKTGTLTVDVEPKSDGRVIVDGYILGHNAGFDEAELLVGEYTVEARATDHVSQTEKVEIQDGKEAKFDFELDKKLFHGTLSVDVSEKGATIKLEPKELDSPRASKEAITVESPLEKPKKLATGKYFLEVTKPGYDRWIRNIYIKRDEETSVQIKLSRALPAAILGD